MEYKVVYFTRTGTSRRVAEKIAEKLSCEIIEITDNKNWNGIIGFIKAGFYATYKKDVEIKTSKETGSFDELIIVSPLWAGTIAPAIRVFLKQVPFEKINLIVTSDGSSIKKRFGYKTETDVIKNMNNEDSVIVDLTNNLLKASEK
ncbi:MAG: flavodoxin family protein [Saccharofermentanales bacterium]